MADSFWDRKQDGIKDAIEKALSRQLTMRAYLNKVAYAQYQKAQIVRWQTENSSEGPKWPDLNSRYAERKKVLFTDFPGGGHAMMIATGKLSAAAMGQGEGALKIIEEKRMVVGIDDGAIPYGKYAAGPRPFMEFSEATIESIAGAAMNYFMTGDE